MQTFYEGVTGHRGADAVLWATWHLEHILLGVTLLFLLLLMLPVQS